MSWVSKKKLTPLRGAVWKSEGLFIGGEQVDYYCENSNE